ncbi:hypothetical protein BGW80DRAFT_293283 [Lactifluus volemus]|nr:hypothetical protein BGW80DRAFT_293283 [Lactifluus volemus]
MDILPSSDWARIGSPRDSDVRTSDRSDASSMTHRPSSTNTERVKHANRETSRYVPVDKVDIFQWPGGKVLYEHTKMSSRSVMLAPRPHALLLGERSHGDRQLLINRLPTREVCVLLLYIHSLTRPFFPLPGESNTTTPHLPVAWIHRPCSLERRAPMGNVRLCTGCWTLLRRPQ